MPVRRILWFILGCITMLGVLAYFYPADGLTIGPLHLRFPTLQDVLEGEKTDSVPTITPDEQLAKMSEAFYWKNISELADSLEEYQHFFAKSTVRIQFPNNDPSLFDPFFSAMDEVRGKHRLIRVVHYGDSQIEQDRITGSIRKSYQEKFGGSGIGLIPAVQTIPTPYLIQENEGNWQRYTVYGKPEGKASHNRYGPMGLVCEFSDTASISVEARSLSKVPNFKQYRQIRLLVGNNDSAFMAVLDADGYRVEKYITEPCAGLSILTWRLTSPIHQFKMYFSGKAEIYGLLLDGNEGVAVDNIPMRGCSGTIFTRIDADNLRQAYQAMDVRLFILEFGGNRMPSIEDKDDIAKYARSIGRQIRYLKSLAPSAEVLFIGPADMSRMVDGEMKTYPYLESVIAALKQVCMENSAAFWDMYQVMGGYNSMTEWVKTQPPMAASDYVHFTYKGSQRISELLNKSLSVCYDYYHFRKHHLNDSIMTKIDSLDRNADYSQQLYDIIREMAVDSVYVDSVLRPYLEEEQSIEMLEMIRSNEQLLQMKEE